jgi:epoxide hydrolase-like predicted phosphatase
VWWWDGLDIRLTIAVCSLHQSLLYLEVEQMTTSTAGANQPEVPAGELDVSNVPASTNIPASKHDAPASNHDVTANQPKVAAVPDTISGQKEEVGTAKGTSSVKLIVFDMGHVFIDFKFDEVCRGFCTRAGVGMEHFRPVVNRLSKLGYEIGQISTEGFLEQLNVELRAISVAEKIKFNDITVEEFHTLWNHNFSENEEMAELLQHLKGRRALALLSNTNESHFESLESKYKVTRHFGLVFLSYLLGMQKPDLKIYEHVIEKAGLLPEEIVFIDDRTENIDAARSLGIISIQFESPAQLKQELRLLNLLD